MLYCEQDTHVFLIELKANLKEDGDDRSTQQFNDIAEQFIGSINFLGISGNRYKKTCILVSKEVPITQPQLLIAHMSNRLGSAGANFRWVHALAAEGFIAERLLSELK